LQATLVGTLERIGDIDKQLETLDLQAKDLKKQRETLERWVIEELQMQQKAGLRGDEGARAAGRTYWVEEDFSISVPKDRRDAVLEAARAAGIEDAITTVATTTLKSWLREEAKRADKEVGQPFSEGTPFAGLVSEFTTMKLRHRAVR
jgi:hypothetical protein